MEPMPSDSAARLLLTRVVPWLAVPLAFFTTVALLGGSHPSDATRDGAVLGASVLSGLLQLPAVFLVVEAVRASRFTVARDQIALLLMRAVICVPPLLLAGSISHEGRG